MNRRDFLKGAGIGMSGKYPKHVVDGKRTIETRPGIRRCHLCGIAFKKHEVFVVLEIQHDWFRGNDEVRGYHQGCWEK